MEILTRENPEFQNLTTQSLLQEARDPSDKQSNSHRPERKQNVNSLQQDVYTEKSRGQSSSNTNESHQFSLDIYGAAIERKDTFIYDLLDETFREKLSQHELDILKRVPTRRPGSTANVHFVWRSKNLQSYEEGGRVGPLDCGKGRKSNWHIPFFGFQTNDDLVKLNKETLRVACLLCSNLTTVQCVQSTMQRHLALKHEALTKALTQNAISIKSDVFWKNIVRQIKYVYLTTTSFLFF